MNFDSASFVHLNFLLQNFFFLSISFYYSSWDLTKKETVVLYSFGRGDEI
jgi:hypothetical protein